MTHESKCYKVSIFGDQYSLLSDESEKCVMQSATLVDMIMKEISDKSGILDIKKVAVLASLRIASRLLQRESEIEENELKKEKLIDVIDHELHTISHE